MRGSTSGFPPAKFAQLKDKMGPVVQFAMGAFIQSLGQNPGIEQYLQALGLKCHIYVGTGIGDITITQRESLVYERTLRRWNEFWGAPERCTPLRRHLGDGEPDPAAPRSPSELEHRHRRVDRGEVRLGGFLGARRATTSRSTSPTRVTSMRSRCRRRRARDRRSCP